MSLIKLEKRIEANRKAAWYENNLILLRIRNEELYKKKYDTFENYLKERWGYDKSRGYQLMKSAEFLQIAEKNMGENVDEKAKIVDILPQNEWQIRPLLRKLNHHGERLKVWEDVVESGENITAKLVQSKVDDFLQSGETVPYIEYDDTDVIDVGKKNHRAQGTGKNEWYTPQEYIDMAIQVMGYIDTDPASSDIANKKVQAKRFYTLNDEGLNREWHGKVWLNPPYAQPAINNFAEKMAAEWQSGRVDEAIVLTHNYTDTKWFHTLADVCNAVCFNRGRIAFIDLEGNKASPTQGQAFFYFGQNVERFSSIFKEKGKVLHVS